MLIKIDSKCNNCIHKEVCCLKSNFTDTINKITEQMGNMDLTDCFSISLSCKNYLNVISERRDLVDFL